MREVTLVTTLVDAELYPLEVLAELYRRRWEVEGHLKNLKTTMKMEVLRCETVAGVSKELLMFALVYHLVRLVMLEASRRQEVPVDRNRQPTRVDVFPAQEAATNRQAGPEGPGRMSFLAQPADQGCLFSVCLVSN